jgi:hypothetical protein
MLNLKFLIHDDGFSSEQNLKGPKTLKRLHSDRAMRRLVLIAEPPARSLIENTAVGPIAARSRFSR